MELEKGNKKKIAAVFGATGLVGQHVVQFLIENPNYKEIRVFVRNEMPWSCPQMKVIKTDFTNLNKLYKDLDVDEVFCCIGTTRSKVANLQSFIQIDYEIPAQIASLAMARNVDGFFVISSLGANKHSQNYYLRTKGRLEEHLINQKFNRLIILRPSLLLGLRKEFRLIEEITKLLALLFYIFLIGPFARYRPISSESVARSMVKLANGKYTKQIYESPEIRKIGRKI
jgi:uncharacterized protein YbjT (DUF2867 family)